MSASEFVYDAVNLMQGISWQTVAFVAVLTAGITSQMIRRSVERMARKRLDLDARNREIELEKTRFLQQISHDAERRGHAVGHQSG